MTYKGEIESGLIWLGQWPGQNSDNYILEQLYQGQNTNTEHLTWSDCVGCCLLPEAKCLRDHKHEPNSVVRAQSKGGSNYKFMHSDIHATLYCLYCQSIVNIQFHNIFSWFTWNPSSFYDSWLCLMNLNFRISLPHVCLGQVFATFLLSGMAGSADAGQDFLAWDYGIISVHLGSTHFIKIHPQSTVLILLSINSEQQIASL